MTRFQNHHVIPKELFSKHSLLKKLSNKDSIGFNLIALPEENSSFITNHKGSHPGYTDFIAEQLDIIEKATQGDVEVSRNNGGSGIYVVRVKICG